MPAGSVRGYVAAQAASVMARHLRAREVADFSVEREVNLYLRPGHVAVPDVFLYLRRPASKPAGAGSYVVPRDGAPELVLEILSRSTWRNDVPYADDEETVETQKDFYQACGVAEYWIYDPEACRPAPAARLEGFRLRPNGAYAALAPEPARQWFSAVLDAAWGLAAPAFLGADRYLPLRLRDPRTGGWYPTIEEHDRLFGEQSRQLDEQGQQIDNLKAVLARYREQFGPLE